MTRRLHYPALLLACFAFGYWVVPSNANDIPLPPGAPCTLGNRMNVEIVNGWMYECECVVLARGFHCSWYLIGKVESVTARKFKRQHRRLIPVLYIKPKVVG